MIEEAPVQIRVLAKKSVERLAFFVPKITEEQQVWEVEVLEAPAAEQAEG